MFDHTMIMYFPEGGETHHASGVEAPFVILAGNNCKLDLAGRYIRLPYHATEGHKTIGNWYTTLLNAHGNPIKHYGDLDLDMSRLKLEQTGAISRFIA
jgi:L-ascorbate metabolism protein UlaG (beta-lactamase superfamily)